MNVINHKTSGFEKFFSGGIPFHAVNLARNPFSVCRIASKLWKSRNRQNMIKRVVKAQDDFLSSVGALIVLSLQFISDYVCVFSGFQAVRGSLSKITPLAKRILTALHRRKRRELSTAVTKPFRNHPSLPSGRRCQRFILALLAKDERLNWRLLTAVSAQARFFKAVIPREIMPSMRDFSLFCLSIPLSGEIDSSATFVRALHGPSLPRSTKNLVYLSQRCTTFGGVQ